MQRFKLNIKQSFNNINGSRLRSFLAILGVLVGTASVVTLISTSQLATEHALSMFKSLGTNLISVQISPGASPNTTNHLSLTVRELNGMEQRISSILQVAPYKSRYGKVSYQSVNEHAEVIGATPALMSILKITLDHGRLMSHLDQHQLFGMIGASLAKKMMPQQPENIIGKQILYHGHYISVIGILKPWIKNLFFYAEIDKSIIIPIQSFNLLPGDSSIAHVLFMIKPGVDLKQSQKLIEKNIKIQHPGYLFFFQNPNQIIQAIKGQRQSLTLLLAFIGLISLMVGAIGVMNIMLVSVIERRQEIGIRLAVGAKEKDIVLMFLSESVVLTLLGGALGVLIGSIITFIIGQWSGWGYHFLWLPTTLGLVISVVSGLISGIYPAYRASQLKPVEILNPSH
jgi:putative ABC transport system permease protein